MYIHYNKALMFLIRVRDKWSCQPGQHHRSTAKTQHLWYSIYYINATLFLQVKVRNLAYSWFQWQDTFLRTLGWGRDWFQFLAAFYLSSPVCIFDRREGGGVQGVEELVYSYFIRPFLWACCCHQSTCTHCIPHTTRASDTE